MTICNKLKFLNCFFFDFEQTEAQVCNSCRSDILKTKYNSMFGGPSRSTLATASKIIS